LAFYLQLSSLRRVARALSEIHRLSKTAIWKRVRKLSERIAWILPRLGRDLVKVNGLEYRVYVAIDVDCSNNQIVVTFVTVRFEKIERIFS